MLFMVKLGGGWELNIKLVNKPSPIILVMANTPDPIDLLIADVKAKQSQRSEGDVATFEELTQRFGAISKDISNAKVRTLDENLDLIEYLQNHRPLPKA